MEASRQSAIDMLDREFGELCFFPDKDIRVDAQRRYVAFRRVFGNGIAGGQVQVSEYAGHLRELTMRVQRYRQASRSR